MKTYMTIILSTCILTLMSCSGGQNKTTDKSSEAFATTDQKVEFFETYVVPKTEIKNVGFHITYHDNGSGMVPGPSDWDIKAIIHVPPDAAELWVKDMKLCESGINVRVWERLELFNEETINSEKFQYFCESAKVIGINTEASIVLAYMSTQMQSSVFTK